MSPADKIDIKRSTQLNLEDSSANFAAAKLLKSIVSSVETLLPAITSLRARVSLLFSKHTASLNYFYSVVLEALSASMDASPRDTTTYGSWLPSFHWQPGPWCRRLANRRLWSTMLTDTPLPRELLWSNSKLTRRDSCKMNGLNLLSSRPWAVLLPPRVRLFTILSLALSIKFPLDPSSNEDVRGYYFATIILCI